MAKQPKPNYHQVVMYVSDVTDAPQVRGKKNIVAQALLKMEIKQAKKMYAILGKQIEAHKEGAGLIALQAEGEFRS